MYKKILIISLLLSGFSWAFYLSKEKERLGAIIPKEVPMYWEDFSDMICIKTLIDKTTQVIPYEKNFALIQGEKVGCSPTKKLRVLEENEYYKTGNTDIGSTTSEIVVKQSGVKSIKMLSEL